MPVHADDIEISRICSPSSARLEAKKDFNSFAQGSSAKRCAMSPASSVDAAILDTKLAGSRSVLLLGKDSGATSTAADSIRPWMWEGAGTSSSLSYPTASSSEEVMAEHVSKPEPRAVTPPDGSTR
jgi:hypothetical protein